MEVRDVDIQFPLSGQVESISFDRQPEGTTPDCSNVVPHDPRTGRLRGAQRSGLSKHETVAIGTTPVQEIIHLTRPGFTDRVGNGSVVVDTSGQLNYSWTLYDSSGVALVEYDDTVSYTLQQAAFDADGNVYVSMLDSTTLVVRIVKYSAAGSLQWTRDITVSASPLSQPAVMGMLVSKDALYVFWRGENPGDYYGSIRRYNLSDGSEIDASPWVASPAADIFGNNDEYEYQHGSWLSGDTNRIVWAQWDPADHKLDLLFLNTDTGSTVSTVSLYDGTGSLDTTSLHGLAADGMGGFYVHYHTGHPVSGTGYVTKYSGDGTQVWQQSYTINAEGTGDNIGFAYLPDLHYLAIGGNNAYGTCNQLVILDASDGSKVSDHNPGTEIGHLGGDGNGGLIVSDESQVLRLDTDFVTVLWTTTNNGDRLHLRTSDLPLTLQSGVKEREIRSLAVSGGTVKRFDAGVAGAVTVTNGSDALSNRPVVFGATLLGNVFFADGSSTKYYRSATNSIETWSPTTGSLPVDGNSLRCRLIESWGGRIVMSGLQGDPQNWFMSAVDDPFDFNYSNDPVGVQDAVAGSNAETAQLGDTVNAMVPFSDDILIFGGDHSLWQMTGNPAAGGRLDEVSDITGMAWGRPWTRDATGVVWFIGSRGGLYRMVPAQSPERISLRSLDEKFSEIDMQRTLVRLAWDDRLVGLWITLTSTDLVATSTHYWYDARSEGFFPVSFANAVHEPHVLHIYDGDDPEDRRVLLGCRDGYVREFDPDATDDDGTAIDSYVLIGPIHGAERVPILLNELRVTLGSGSSDVDWSLHVGETAEQAASASAVASGTVSAGRNPSIRNRLGGHAMYLKLRNSTVAESWSIERLAASIRLTSSGFRRRF